MSRRKYHSVGCSRMEKRQRVAQVGEKGYREDGIIVQIATLQGSNLVDGLAMYIAGPKICEVCN